MEGMLIAEVVSDGAVIELVAAGKAPDSTIESDVPGSASFDENIVDTAMPEGLTAATQIVGRIAKIESAVLTERCTVVPDTSGFTEWREIGAAAPEEYTEDSDMSGPTAWREAAAVLGGLTAETKIVGRISKIESVVVTECFTAHPGNAIFTH